MPLPDLPPELTAYRDRASRPTKGPRASRRTHDWVDERDRAVHAAVAEHLRQDPSLVRVALRNLDRFGATASPGTRWAFAEWRRLIRELPVAELLEFLTSGGEHATRMRQSSPFFGILPRAERDAIFDRFETL